MNLEEKKVWMKKYAELLVRFGVNIQSGQKLVFVLPHEARDFGIHVVEAAYEANSGQVVVYYLEHDLYRIKQQKALIETLEDEDNTVEQALGSLIDNGAAILFLVGAHPEAMSADTSEQRKAAFNHSFMRAINEIHSRRRSLNTNSCAAAYPTKEYASFLFPESDPGNAESRLMEMLTPILKLDTENAGSAWQEKRNKLNHRADLLNNYNFDSLHFYGGKTDLSIGLVKNHIWISAFQRAKNGIECAVNLPTEELFTAPDWRRAEGRITSTRKTFIHGFTVDEATLEFSKGRIITAATEGDSGLLRQMLDYDKQSRYPGEVALVSEDSPIANQPMSFKNLLFDENAGCHIAFGSSYPHSIKNGASMTGEELLDAGMNVSNQHIDLIIGSAELSVTGITSAGERVEIITDGLWTGEFT